MAVQTETLAIVAATARRLTESDSEDARDLAWWVLRVIPGLDRVVIASAGVRTAALVSVGQAMDTREDAVRSLLTLVGAR